MKRKIKRKIVNYSFLGMCRYIYNLSSSACSGHETLLYISSTGIGWSGAFITSPLPHLLWRRAGEEITVMQ